MIGRTLSGRKLPKPTFLTMPSSYELAILKGLQGMQVYHGTVPAAVKASRRARGTIAKASRKANRGH
jgi:hypothetical protein